MLSRTTDQQHAITEAKELVLIAVKELLSNQAYGNVQFSQQYWSRENLTHVSDDYRKTCPADIDIMEYAFHHVFSKAKITSHLKTFARVLTELDGLPEGNEGIRLQVSAAVKALTQYRWVAYGIQPVENILFTSNPAVVKREKTREEMFLDTRSKLLVQNQLLESMWEEAVFGFNQRANQELSKKYPKFIEAFLAGLKANSINQKDVSGQDVCQYYCLYAHVQLDLKQVVQADSQEAKMVNARVNDYITYHAENNQLEKINPVVLLCLGQKAANPDQALASKVETDAVLENTDEPVVVAQVNKIQSENVAKLETTAYPVDNPEVAVAIDENSIDTIVQNLKKVNEYSGGTQVNLLKVIQLLELAANAMHNKDDAQLKSALSAAGAVVKGRMSFWNQALSCRAMSFFSSNNAWAGVQRQQAYEVLLPLIQVNSLDAKDVNAALSKINNGLETVLAKKQDELQKNQVVVSGDSAKEHRRAQPPSLVPTVIDYLSMR